MRTIPMFMYRILHFLEATAISAGRAAMVCFIEHQVGLANKTSVIIIIVLLSQISVFDDFDIKR